MDMRYGLLSTVNHNEFLEFKTRKIRNQVELKFQKSFKCFECTGRLMDRARYGIGNLKKNMKCNQVNAVQAATAFSEPERENFSYHG